MRRNWTKEEIEYVESSWGVYSIPKIAKNLNRTLHSIKVKAVRIGLKRALHQGDYITFNQLMVEFKINGGYARNIWIKAGCPVKEKRIIKKKYKIIYLNQFWTWAEKNKNIINFAKLEENILGEEPGWVKEKRKIDMVERNKNTPWETIEDERLKYLLREYKHTYADLAVLLNRSEGAIKRRIIDLNLKERPLREANKPWTDKEIKKLVEMRNKGHTWEKIGMEIGRTGLATRGKHERLINPDYMKRKNREGGCYIWKSTKGM